MDQGLTVHNCCRYDITSRGFSEVWRSSSTSSSFLIFPKPLLPFCPQKAVWELGVCHIIQLLGLEQDYLNPKLLFFLSNSYGVDKELTASSDGDDEVI